MDIFSNNQTFELGQVQTRGGGSFGPIRQNHLALWIALKGKMAAKVDDFEFQVSRGQAGFFYAQTIHELRYDTKEISYLWCSSTITPDTGFIASKESLSYLKRMPNVLAPSRELHNLMRIGSQMQNRQGMAAQRVRTAIGESAFNEYFYLANIQEEDNVLPRSVVKAKKFITDNYADANCQAIDIAKASAMSPQHLSKLFKQYMQYSPVKYLWHLRGEKAIHLLKYSNLPISEITIRCGFKDQFHFSRYINRHYSHSPREIRKRHWNSSFNSVNKN
ncbi:MAG: helix-turn-helix domain-containing protein [Gammaproteobacteria bacterium]|nr:helix-turn-helix domain-containing protein [Gammaproteobacteria bacterium]